MISMPTPSQHPLHLFRAILREAGYHPDPAARSYLKRYATNSFRTAKIRLATSRKWGPEKRGERDVRLMRSARHFCSILKRSNEGYLAPFRKTLSLTYGRTGQRRRPLMKQIMRVRAKPKSIDETALSPVDARDARTDSADIDEPASSVLELFELSSEDLDTAETSSHEQPGRNFGSEKRLPRRVRQHEPYIYSPGIPAWPVRHYRPLTPDQIPPMFQSLSISQSSAASRIPTQNRVNKTKGPKLPESTIWNRPIPESRTRKAMMKWFAREAALLYPYLPPDEWAYIRDIALGKTCLTVPSRRPTASTRVFAPADPPTSPTPSLLAWPEAEPRQHGRKQGNPHRMTQRFLTREYEWLLRHVPLLIGGEGEAAYGSSPTVPQLAIEAQSQSNDAQDPEVPMKQPGQTISASGAPGAAAEEEEQQQDPKLPVRRQRPRPTGVFLWHSTVLDKPEPRKMVPQQLGKEANKALFG